MFVNVIHAMSPTTPDPPSSSKPRPREQRASDTRARICEASLAIVTSEGFEALTMQRLGRELGCAAGGIYRYFPSKSDIVLALLQGVIASVAADIFAASERQKASRAIAKLTPGEQGLVTVLAACEGFLALRSLRPAHAHLIGLALGDPRELVADPGGHGAPHLLDLARVTQHLGQGLDAASHDGSLRKGDTLARIVTLFGALHGVLQLKKLERLESLGIDSTALARGLLVDLLVAWGAPAETVALAHRHARRIATLPQGATTP